MPVTGDVVKTGFGALDVVPQSGESLIPISLGNGPSAVAVNLRIGRSFGIGPKVGSSGGPEPSGPPPGAPPPGEGPGGGGPGGGGPGGGGPGGGGPGGGGGFGGGFGGGHGGMRGGAPNTGRKYSLNFNVQALNLFNDIDRGKPVGSIQPTFNSTTGQYDPGAEFGKSTGLAGGIFSTPSAARRIFFQVAFQF